MRDDEAAVAGRAAVYEPETGIITSSHMLCKFHRNDAEAGYYDNYDNYEAHDINFSNHPHLPSDLVPQYCNPCRVHRMAA